MNWRSFAALVILTLQLGVSQSFADSFAVCTTEYNQCYVEGMAGILGSQGRPCHCSGSAKLPFLVGVRGPTFSLREPIVVSRIALEKIAANPLDSKKRDEFNSCIQGLKAASPKGSDGVVDAVYPVRQSACELDSKTICPAVEGPVGTPCVCQIRGDNKIGWRTREVTLVSYDVMPSLDLARDMADRYLRVVYKEAHDEHVKDVVRSCFNALNSDGTSGGYQESSKSPGAAQLSQ